MTGSDVVIAGGGIIGMAVAWRLAQCGVRVTVVDATAGRGATATAAGMLAPVTELHYGEEALLRLNLASAERFPAFVAEVEDESGLSASYRSTGTIAVGLGPSDVAGLRDLLDLQRALGLRAEWLTGTEVHSLEPSLAPGIPGGVLAADDHSVDPRRLHAALTVAAERCGARIDRRRAAAVRADPPRVDLSEGPSLRADAVVIAAGAWSPRLTTALPRLPLPVRPVKGQTVRLRGPVGDPSRVVRGSVRGFPVYVVPRKDGELVVGASSEEAGFDARHRTGAVLDLLRHAQALLPGLAETEVTELSTSLRPATPDNAPLIGPTSYDGIVVATGHYRNGVLLAPVTADAVATLMTTGTVVEEIGRFSPDRFAPSHAPTP